MNPFSEMFFHHSFMFHRRKRVMQVWINVWVSILDMQCKCICHLNQYVTTTLLVVSWSQVSRNDQNFISRELVIKRDPYSLEMVPGLKLTETLMNSLLACMSLSPSSPSMSFLFSSCSAVLD